MLHSNKSSVVNYIFSAYLIPLYVSFIIVRNCGFDIEYVILAIFFDKKLLFLM